MFKRLFWAALGIAATYLFDPISGRSRRARLKDQLKARARDAAETTSQQTRYQAGKARGVVHEVFGEETAAATDHDLLQKVRSEAVGRANGETSHISIDVDEGVVTLRGTSQDLAGERDLIERIKDVEGVRFVRNDLVSA